MRVFVGGVATETNTFSPMPTGMADYEPILRPEDLETTELRGMASVIGVLKELTEASGWEFVFGLHCFAQPAGKTVRSVYESLRDELLDRLKAAMPVDIVFLPLHGAMVAEGYDDCETDLVQRVRAIVGPDAKIGVELDLHCDVTQETVDASDAVILYKEYPHTDIVDRMRDLFTIIADTAEGKIKPTMALYDCRMIGMYLTPFQPMRGFVDEMFAMEGKDGLLSVSLAHCFPWADVSTTTVKTLAITDNNPAQAVKVAEELGKKFFALRHTVTLAPLSMSEALDKALATEGGPMVIADQSDNAGGGAASDSTFVLREMLERGIQNAAIGMIWDPIAVQVAIAAGEGAKLDLRLGGKLGPTSGDPLDLSVTVKGVAKDLIQQWPQTVGTVPAACGDTVCLECNGINIIVNTNRSQVFGLEVFTAFGIDLAKTKIVVVKSTQHFYAAFGPIAKEVIYMAAPGAIPPLFTQIPYKNVDLHKYPWVDDPFTA